MRVCTARGGEGTGNTHVVSRVLGRRVVQRDVLDRVRRSHEFGVPSLALRGPHGDAREEASVGVFELAEGITHIAAEKRQSIDIIIVSLY